MRSSVRDLGSLSRLPLVLVVLVFAPLVSCGKSYSIVKVVSVDRDEVCVQPITKQDEMCLTLDESDDSSMGLEGKDADWYVGREGQCIRIYFATHAADYDFDRGPIRCPTMVEGLPPSTR